MPQFPSTRHVLAADCQRCPSLVDSRTCISWGTGNREAAVLVVGEAPGAGDPDADRWRGGNWTGKAYTTRHSGRQIRELLETIGIDDAYYTNAVKCFPADPEDPTTNREPTATERANCRPYLRQEIDSVDPTVVLATGKHATKSVLARTDHTLDGFLDHVLEPVQCSALETWLVPLIHPSYQAVWIARLGYDRDEYLDALRETLVELGVLGGDG